MPLQEITTKGPKMFLECFLLSFLTVESKMCSLLSEGNAFAKNLVARSNDKFRAGIKVGRVFFSFTCI